MAIYNCTVDASVSGGKIVPVAIEGSGLADAMRKAITAAFKDADFAAAEPEEITVLALKRIPKQTGLF